MSEPGNPNYRLQDLQQRWAADPDSRIYQQLAEEYLKGGQPGEAAQVLEQGLSRRPGDIGGYVALGRCRLDLGQVDQATAALETVIDKDPAHHVANKLLLEAYLQQGDAAKASERLETYRLLNDRDPELEHLAYRLSQLELEALAGHTEADTSPSAGPTLAEQALAGMAIDATASVEPTADTSLALDQTIPMGTSIEAVAAESLAAAEPDPAHSDIFGLGREVPPPPNFDALWEQASASGASTSPEEPFGALETPAEVPETSDEEQIFSLESPTDGSVIDGGAPTEPLHSVLVDPVPAIEVAEAPVESPQDEGPALELPPTGAFLNTLTEPAATPPAATTPELEMGAEPAVEPEPVVEAEPEPEPVVEAEPIIEPEPVPEPVVEAEPVVAVEPEPEPVVEAEPVVEPEPVIEPLMATPEPLAASPEPANEPAAPWAGVTRPDVEQPEAAAEASTNEEVATVTLGSLYLKQGHHEEAAKIFEKVLEQEPGNHAALAGLNIARPQKTGLSAMDLLADRSLMGTIPADKTTRKIMILNNYLKHLKAGQKRNHVH